ILSQPRPPLTPRLPHLVVRNEDLRHSLRPPCRSLADQRQRRPHPGSSARAATVRWPGRPFTVGQLGHSTGLHLFGLGIPGFADQRGHLGGAAAVRLTVGGRVSGVLVPLGGERAADHDGQASRLQVGLSHPGKRHRVRHHCQAHGLHHPDLFFVFGQRRARRFRLVRLGTLARHGPRRRRWRRVRPRL
ncbi:hypothetical protein IE53DRAFT_381877, partial [Violaceomyces palustris]